MKPLLLPAALCLMATATKLVRQSSGIVSAPPCIDYKCSEGWVPKQNQSSSLRGASDEACCQQTCRLWTCDNHSWLPNSNYSDNVGFSNDACCDGTCRALGAEKCPDGQGIEYGKLGLLGTTVDACCDALPLCVINESSNESANQSSFPCPDGFALVPAEAKKRGRSKENCCVESCMSFNGCLTSLGLVRKPSAQGLAIPKFDRQNETLDFCCDKTCEHFQGKCPEGYTMDDEDTCTLHKTVTDKNWQSTCCVPKCSAVKCQDGYVHDDAVAGQLTSKVLNCCVPTCITHDCSASGLGLVSNNRSDFKIGAAGGDADCCDRPCSTLVCDTAHGWHNSTDEQKLAQIGNREEICCEQSCIHFNATQCPVGTAIRERTVALTISPPSAGVCCELDACEVMRTMRNRTQENESCNDFNETMCNQSYDLATGGGGMYNFTVVPCYWNQSMQLCRHADTALTECSPFK